MVEEAKKITFNEHPFAMQLAHFLLLEVKNGGFKQSNPKYNYLRSVDRQCEKIEYTLRTIQISRILLAERHPDAGVYSNVKRNDFLRYIFENYFLRITTYKDQILHLIDVVLDLEIERNIQFEKKLKAKISDFKEIINAIEKVNFLFADIRSTRNQIAHEGRIHIPDLYTLELNEVGFEELPEYREMIKLKDAEVLNKFILDNTKAMMEIEGSLATNFFSILNMLLEHFVRVTDAKANN